MPATLPERRHAGKITEPKLNLVGSDECRDEIASAAVLALTDRELHGQVAARMGGIAREVVVVAVEVTQQAAVNECCQWGRGLLSRADQRRLGRPATIGRHPARS